MPHLAKLRLAALAKANLPWMRTRASTDDGKKSMVGVKSRLFASSKPDALSEVAEKEKERLRIMTETVVVPSPILCWFQIRFEVSRALTARSDFGARDEAYERFLDKLELRLTQLSHEIPTVTLTISKRCRRAVAMMSLKDYMDRLIRGTNKLIQEDDAKVVESTGARCAVMACEYVERACDKGVSGVDIHELFLAAFTVAFKIADDLETDSQWWAHIGGLELKEVNATELMLCSKLDWDLSISPSSFGQQRRKMALSCLSFSEIDVN